MLAACTILQTSWEAQFELLDKSRELIISDGSGQRSVQYDYLVIATGTAYGSATSPSPIRPTSAEADAPERLAVFEAARSALAAAQSVKVVGGGVVGVELAACRPCPCKRLPCKAPAPPRHAARLAAALRRCQIALAGVQ